MKIEKKEEDFSRSFKGFQEWMESIPISKFSIFSSTTVEEVIESFIKSKKK